MVYLRINKKAFEEMKTYALDKWKQRGFENEEYIFDNLDFEIEEQYIDNEDSLEYSVTLLDQDRNDFGYFSTNIKLDFDDIIKLIKSYQKKLDKLKEVFERIKETKDENGKE